jgi:hypothetical protein
MTTAVWGGGQVDNLANAKALRTKQAAAAAPNTTPNPPPPNPQNARTDVELLGQLLQGRHHDTQLLLALAELAAAHKLGPARLLCLVAFDGV